MGGDAYRELLGTEAGAEAFVRRALELLEGQTRELALLAVGEWEQLGLAGYGDLLPVVASMEAATWGTWNGLLGALRAAREQALALGTAEERARVERAAGLGEIMALWDGAVAGGAGDGAGAGSLAAAIGGAMEAGNRLVYGTAPEAAWWGEAAAGLRGLVGFMAGDPMAGIRERVPRRAPWFAEERGEVWSLEGRAPDFSAVYTGHGGAKRQAGAEEAGLGRALGRLLGIPQEREVRRLLARHAPEEIRGVLLGDFLIGRPVGEGGFGAVHVGRQLSTGRKVAIKLLHDGMPVEMKARFAREAGYLARFNHRNIVSVLAHGEGRWSVSPLMDLSGQAWFQGFAKSAPVKTYIAMEWVEGRTLEAVYQEARQGRERRPAVAELAEWLAQAARALGAVHGAGLVHRDVKPGNLMVTGERTIKLMDFGIAGSQEAGATVATTAGRVFGTILYMSPEQIRAVDAAGRIGPGTDIYSLCATFYELFTLKRVYDHDAQSVEAIKTLKLAGQRPQPPRKQMRDLPWEIEVILLGGLEAEVGDRYGSMEALERDVRHFLADEPIEYRRPSWARRARLGYRRHRGVTNVAGASVLLAVLGVGFYIHAIRQEQARTAAETVRALAERDAKEAQRAAAENNAYAKNIALAYREWQANNLSRALQLLADCPTGLRRMEWNYLEWLCHGALVEFQAQDHGVRCLAVSPDGGTIATASDARVGDAGGAEEVGQVRLWDARTGKLLRTIAAHKSAATRLAFSPDGRRLLSAADGEVCVWATDTGKREAEFHGPYRRVAFSADGKRFAYNEEPAGGGLAPEATWVKVWDMGANREVFAAQGVTRALRSVEISPDGKLVAAADLMNGQSVTVWDCASGEKVSTFRADASGDGSIMFSPDSRFLLARIGGDPRDAELSDQSGGVIVNPHGPGRMEMWDVRTGRMVYAEPRPEHALVKAVFSPDGQHFAAAREGGTLEIWDLTDMRTPEVLRGHVARISDVAFTPDGLRLVSADSAGVTKVWDVTTPQDGAALQAFGRVTGMGFTREGKSLVASTTAAGLPLGEVPAANDVGQGIRTWSLASGQITSAIVTGPGFEASALSPAGDAMAASVGRTVVVMNVAGGSKVCEVRHEAPVTAVACSADGQLVYSVDEGSSGQPGEIKVWQAKDGKMVRSERRGSGGFACVAVEAGGSRVAAGGDDGIVDVWETATWRHVAALAEGEGPASRPASTRAAQPTISAVTWSGQGILAAGDDRGGLALWDVAAGRRVATLRGHTDRVLAAVFDGAGDRLITSGRDKTLKIWETHSGQEVLTLRPHGTRIDHVALSADGKWLASSGDDQKIRIYPVGEMTAAAEAARRRQLEEAAGAWRWSQLRLTGTAEQWYPFVFQATALLAAERGKAEPKAADLIRLLGARADAYRKLGEPEKALADYEEGTKLGDRWAWQDMGYVQAQLGHWPEALEAYGKAEEEGAMSATAWRAYGLLELRAGDVAGYRKFCARIADRAGDADGGIALQAAWTCVLAPGALAAKEQGAIVRAAEKLSAAAPENHKALTILGAALLRAGQLEPAGEKLLAAVKAGGEDMDIADELFLTILLEKEGKVTEAAGVLADAKKRIAACRDAQANDPTYQAPSWETWVYVEALEGEAEGLAGAAKP